jgi:hypothetical protein
VRQPPSRVDFIPEQPDLQSFRAFPSPVPKNTSRLPSRVKLHILVSYLQRSTPAIFSFESSRSYSFPWNRRTTRICALSLYTFSCEDHPPTILLQQVYSKDLQLLRPFTKDLAIARVRQSSWVCPAVFLHFQLFLTSAGSRAFWYIICFYPAIPLPFFPPLLALNSCNSLLTAAAYALSHLHITFLTTSQLILAIPTVR